MAGFSAVWLLAPSTPPDRLQWLSFGISKPWPTEAFRSSRVHTRAQLRSSKISYCAYSEDGEGHNSPSLPGGDFSRQLTGSNSGSASFVHNVAISAELNLEKQGMQLPEKGYIGLFVRMLGLDNPVEDREEAVRALWRYSMGGKECIDEIVNFPRVLSLVVSLLRSSRSASCEAAAGLLRNISSFSSYVNVVAEVGAVEEIIGILTRCAVSEEVWEQLAGCLRNLSFQEQIRAMIDMSELLPSLIPVLDTGGPCKDAVVGILSNFSLDEGNHDILVQAGTIRKLRNMIKSGEGSKVLRQGAHNILLSLVQNEHFKQLVIDEGFVPVPVIGATAYQSFKPLLDSTPSFSEEVKFDPSQSMPSAFGAGKLLLGLNIEKNGHELDEATRLVIEGRARQHFLGRIGLLEKESQSMAGDNLKTASKFTIMPWWDGIPRIVLILGLEDVTVARLAATTISEIAINEEVCQAIQKAGGIAHLIHLLGSGDESATEAAAAALERLSVSYKVRKTIDSHGAIPLLVQSLNLLKAEDCSSYAKEKVLGVLHRLTQTEEEVKAMIWSGAFPGLKDYAESKNATVDAKHEVEGILEELSMKKVDSRDKIVDAGGIPVLISMLAYERSTLKAKAANVLENIAAKEQYCVLIARSGLEKALKSVLEVDPKAKDDIVNTEEFICLEETWVVVSAASRLLNKILTFEDARESMECQSLAKLLAKILKCSRPSYVKNWVSACLLKLDRLVGLSTNVGVPLEVEVTVYDTIPKLVDEIGDLFDPDIQERAVIQMRDLVSQGIEDYVAAISEKGGIFPLVQLLEKGTPLAREAALAVLYSLGMNEENHAAIMNAGAVPILQRIVRTESHEWMLALDLLRALPI